VRETCPEPGHGSRRTIVRRPTAALEPAVAALGNTTIHHTVTAGSGEGPDHPESSQWLAHSSRAPTCSPGWGQHNT